MLVKSSDKFHSIAVLQALLVTFLWSTSWVLIKFGVDDIPPLIFAGLRYGIAFLLLVPIFWHTEGWSTLTRLNRNQWPQFLFLGVIYYGVTQGAQFVSLAYLPAVTANIILGFTPIAVALLGSFILAERPRPWQWVGIAISVVGLLIYFYPVSLASGSVIGLTAAIVGMAANSVSSLWNRSINRTKQVSPLTITTLSMGTGALLLLMSGISLDGWPTLSGSSWLIILWLAGVNTAFAFTLWNHTLRTLSALESTVINNSMAVQIPIMAVIFLGERLGRREWIGLAIAIVGVFMVQFAGRAKNL